MYYITKQLTKQPQNSTIININPGPTGILMEDIKPADKKDPSKRPFWSVSPLYVKIIFISFIVISFGMYYLFFVLEDKLENFPYNYHSIVYPGYKYLLKPLPPKPEKIEVKVVEQPKPVKPKRTSLLEKEVEKAIYKFEKNRVILSNFTDLEVNRKDKNSGEVSGYGGVSDVEVLADKKQPDGFLRIAFKVSLPESFAGFSGKLKGISMSNYRKLAFDVKGKTGSEVFHIIIADAKGKGVVSITSVFPDGFSDEWQRATIPLKEFGSLASSKKIDGSLTFLFENSQGTPYDGEVCFKEVALEK
jgi:hypothetical protein